jgi:hypothetical protein
MVRTGPTLVITGLMILCLSAAPALAGCGSYSTEETSGASTTATSRAATTTTVTTAAEAIESVISISGPAFFERPEGAMLFTKAWGSEPDQVGHGVWEQGMPSQNPILVAMSPDERTIAVGDYANNRVQLFARDGTFLKAIAYPSASLLADVGYDRQGRLFALVGNDVFELPTASDGKIVTSSTYPSGTFPYQLALDDPAVRYQLVCPESEPVWLKITGTAAQAERKVVFSSGELPLGEFNILGYDHSGNCCVMVRVYEEFWEGTESWCYILVSPQGECLGQVRLPLDFWAGGSCAITPSGKILELRSVEAGIIVAEYALR